ncbi:MAG: peptidoglycan DD-metalloendopeptidase family protein [Candidatus Nanopelagicales bacterium]|nr:peptidoglycan DD-metalloendopeptidase family protein [Candidatus Nanopelagicales bacterium]
MTAHTSRRSGARSSTGRGLAKASVGAAVAFALSLGLVTGPGAQADNLTDRKRRVDARLDDAQDGVSSANKKIARATRRVVDVQAQLPAAQANLKRALDAKAAAEAANRKAATALDQATKEMIAAEAKLARLEKRLEELRASVGDFARRAYQMGPFAEVEMLLDAEDPAEFTDRLAAIQSVGRSKNNTLAQMSADRADMAYTELRLEALRRAAQDKKAEAAARVAEAKAAAEGAAAAKSLVDALVRQKQSALRSVRAKGDAIKAEYQRLAAEQERIRQEIAAAAARLENSTGIKPGTGTGSGAWYFPLPGYAIGSDAGWRFHPILRYVRCHAGADIGAPSGVAIHAADDGVVLTAGYSGGYGNFTVIAHGGGLTSGYAHQSQISVGAGQRVKRGQVIGYVGTTGLSTGPHLHFEARVNGQPYSPKGWFGQGPKVPVCV